jgi:hypothetical protein
MCDFHRLHQIYLRANLLLSIELSSRGQHQMDLSFQKIWFIDNCHSDVGLSVPPAYYSSL